MTDTLAITDLSIATSRGVLILDHVSADVRRGEVLGLVGESGSGKTSLGLALLGFSKPGTRISGGRIVLGGTEVLAQSSAALRAFRGARIAYVPQDPTSSLNPQMRVLDQIVEMFREHPEASPSGPERRAAEQLLDHVGLSPASAIGRRYPFELSGGQQQRVGIAMALALNPDFIVLDEPTTGLDVTTQRRILDLIRSTAGTHGAGLVYITHDLAVVSEIADRVAVMYCGRIVEAGPAGKVMRDPMHPYTALLVNSAPRLGDDNRLAGIPGFAPAVGHRPPGCDFAPRCAAASDICRTKPPLLGFDGDRIVLCHKAASSPVVLGDTAPRAQAHPDRARQALLEVRNLEVSYGRGERRYKALSGVSLSLEPGECLAVVGESGSGKTTLGRCIVGLNTADAGQLFFRGQEIALARDGRPADARRSIQMIFQNPDKCLNPVRDIAETLSRSIRLSGNPSQAEILRRSEELLDRVGLSRSVLARFPRELSGGQRQRVAIAAGLALNPDVLVCDEVTSALDVSVQASVVNLLDDLRREGLALLFITHNLLLVGSIADRVMVLQRGSVREEGATADILLAPEHPYTQSLLADMPQLADA